MNYTSNQKVAFDEEKVAFDGEKVAATEKKAAFEKYISELKCSKPTKNNILLLFDNFNYDIAFSRADVIKICNLAPSSAGKLLAKLKSCDLIKPTIECGRSRYQFTKH